MRLKSRRLKRQQRNKQQFLFERLEARRLLASDFMLAVLPDTQYYSESHPEIFASQTQWIADNVDEENIVFVSHVGDVVDNADQLTQWLNADAAMDQLDGVVPYSVAPGNHDFIDLDTHNGPNNFVGVFGSARYEDESWYGGASPDQLNHYQRFSAEDLDFLHLTLEWEPRPGAISWAQGILDANPGIPTIVTTHAYLDGSGSRFDNAESPDGADAEELFQSLITVNPQIFLVLGGNYHDEAHNVSFNDAGLPVLELLTNYQTRSNGGDGYLQLLNFRPDLNRIDVTTYSPSQDDFETDNDSEFSFDLDFDARLSFGDPPTASLYTPLDNGVNDQDDAAGSVRVSAVQAKFEVQLADAVPGIDDTTVTPGTVELRRDGESLSSPNDFGVAYDAETDRLTLSPFTGDFEVGAYTIMLNGGSDKIADLNGNVMAPSTLEVTIDSDSSNDVPPNALYFTMSSLATFPNGLVADDDDIVYFDGTDFNLFFDGSDVGVELLTIDAMTILSSNEILLSFTGAMEFPSISERVDDSDIVKFTATSLGNNTAGTFSLYFDGSDVGLTSSSEDINALSILDNGHLIISTKGDFDVDGADGEDEDLIEFSPDSLGLTHLRQSESRTSFVCGSYDVDAACWHYVTNSGQVL